MRKDDEIRRITENALAAVPLPPPPPPPDAWYEATMKGIYQSIKLTAAARRTEIDYRVFSTIGEYGEFNRSMFERMPLLLRAIDEFFPHVGLSYYKDPNLLRGDARKIYDRLLADGFSVSLNCGLFRISWQS